LGGDNVKGYRRMKRMQKRKKMVRTMFMSTFVLLFAATLYITAVTLLPSPSFILSQLYRAFDSTRVLVINTISNMDIKILKFDTSLLSKISLIIR